MAEEETKPAEGAVDEAVIKAVAERLKFFFSDANVRQDRFMRRELLKTEGDLGFVPIEVLLRFNSIKVHTTDAKVIIEATKTLSDILKVHDDEKSIARVVPFDMSKMDENVPLSLYVRNLPIAEPKEGQTFQKYNVTVKELREMFEPYGNVMIVKLRFKKDSNKGNYPAGGAFVEFETVEEVQKAAAELLTTKDGEKVEPKKKLTGGGNTLEVLLMKEWVESKKKDQGNSASPNKEDAAEAGSAAKRAHEEQAEETFMVDWKPGCVIKVFELSSSCDREAILAAVAKCMDISVEDVKEKKIYADFSRGQTDGAIRFNEPSVSIGEVAAKLTSGEVEIAGSKVGSTKILEGEEESKYWEDFIAFKNKQLKHRAEERGSKKKRYRR